MLGWRNQPMRPISPLTRRRILYSQWKSTHTNAVVFDSHEHSLLQVMLQYRECTLEDSIHNRDSD
jgi:hypothetical protein